MTLAWLIPKIREQGGAYGASLDFERRSGYLALTSYRDPNLIETLATYDGAGAFLRALELSDADLARSIIGSLNRVDPYQLPGAKGFTSLTRYLVDRNGRPIGNNCATSCSPPRPHDFRNFADVMDGVRDRGQIVVMGAEEALTEANRTRGKRLAHSQQDLVGAEIRGSGSLAVPSPPIVYLSAIGASPTHVGPPQARALQHAASAGLAFGQFRLVAVVVTHPFHLVEGVPFVAPLGREVEHAVRSHHHFHAASVGRIGVKDIARFVLPEHADARPFLERVRPRAVVVVESRPWPLPPA